MAALLLTMVVGLFIAYKLFRWEKEEKIRNSAKLWLAAVMTPFLCLGLWQVHTKSNAEKTKMLQRQLNRSETFLMRGARIVVGDGDRHRKRRRAGPRRQDRGSLRGQRTGSEGGQRGGGRSRRKNYSSWLDRRSCASRSACRLLS